MGKKEGYVDAFFEVEVPAHEASLLVGCLRDRGNYHADINVITRQIDRKADAIPWS